MSPVFIGLEPVLYSTHIYSGVPYQFTNPLKSFDKYLMLVMLICAFFYDNIITFLTMFGLLCYFEYQEWKWNLFWNTRKERDNNDEHKSKPESTESTKSTE